MFIIPYCIYRSFQPQRGPRGRYDLFSSLRDHGFLLYSPAGRGGRLRGQLHRLFSSLFSDQYVKSAVLLWRIITFYGNILLTAPFFASGQNKRYRRAGDPLTGRPACFLFRGKERSCAKRAQNQRDYPRL